MLPPEVNSVLVKDGIDFTRNGGTASYQMYTFFIGNHGPFTEKFYANEQDAPSVERRINARVLNLRQLGILPNPTP
jgi:hypothetical protein